MRQGHGLGHATTALRAAPGIPGLARTFAGVATSHALCPDPGLQFPRPRTSCPRDHLYICTRAETVRQSPAACLASTRFSHLHYALPHGFCICFFFPHQAPSTVIFRTKPPDSAPISWARQAQGGARPVFAPPHGSCFNPCRGAFRTDRAAGALAVFASACSRSNPWRDCPARSCSPARTRGPSVLHMRHMGLFMFLFRGMWPMHVWVACFPEAASRQSAARYWDRALQPDRHLQRFWRLPCFRRLRCFPCLCNPQFRVRTALFAVPQSRRIWKAPATELPRFPGTCNASPKGFTGIFAKSENPRGVLLPEGCPSRTGPGVGFKQRPARGRMDLPLCALRGTHAHHWPRIAARVSSMRAPRTAARHHHFMPWRFPCHEMT